MPAQPGPDRSPQTRPRSQGQRRRWGALQGGLGVCIIIASAAIGALATIVARRAPGTELGFFVVAGTIAAALAVRPRAGWMIFPVPILSYLVAALTSGVVVFDRGAGSSSTALAIAAAQWVANGFFAMALATGLAVVIVAARWFLWRRGRPAARDSGRDGAPRPPRAGWETAAEPGYPAGFAGPGSPRPGAAPDGPGGPGGWADPRSRAAGPRPSPRPGSEPYNFSSGA